VTSRNETIHRHTAVSGNLYIGKQPAANLPSELWPSDCGRLDFRNSPGSRNPFCQQKLKDFRFIDGLTLLPFA
jgi:hypothetical protein